MTKLKIFAAILCATATASALNLKETKTFNEWKENLSKNTKEGYYAEVIKKCGFEIKTELDEKIVTPFMAENTSGWSFCDAPLSTISGMCEDATSKAMIKKNINKLVCKLGKKEEASFKMAGGTLTFTFGLGASNLNDKTKEFLENNLK